MRGKFYWKKYQNTRSFFLSHTSKLYQHKQWNVVPKGTAKIDPSNKYNIFPSFIIDQSWNTLQLKNIVLSFHPPFEPITALFTFTGLWPLVLKKIEVKNELQLWKNVEDIQNQALWENLRHLDSCLERKLKTLLNTSFTLTLQSLYEKTFNSYGHMHSGCCKLLILRPCLVQHFTDRQLTYRKFQIGHYWFQT